ncbi:MAG: hypothetical protein K2N47_01805, partial [Clostridia bacterium]|nr:hypothetical protein [Clostridia bacterium]
SIAEQVKTLKAEIKSLIAVAKETTDEYQNLKKKVIAAQKQYPELKAAYQNVKDSKQAEMEAVKKELAKIAKDIDGEILKRYETKRAEKIFPILSEIKADRCSQCGMELSIAGKEIVASGKVIECENCHRFLYKA